MPLFRSYFSIGRKASADKFLKALRAHKFDIPDKNRRLLEGAMQAFHEGHHQNIQTAILHETSIANYHCPHPVPVILLKIAKGSEDKTAAITLALGGIPEQGRKDVLSKALNDSIRHGLGDISFYALLLDAGAEANAAIGGYPGTILATAASNEVHISVIELLCRKGANFRDALTTMHSRNYDPAFIENLKHFEKQIKGPARPAAAPRVIKAMP